MLKRLAASALAVGLALCPAADAGVMPIAAGATGGLSSPITIAAASTTPTATIPADFLGTSYDVGVRGFTSGFFTTANTPFLNFYKLLGPSGNIRIGGTPSNTVLASQITSAQLTKLQAFMGQLGSGWTLLWGLNVYTDTAANAVAEVGLIESIFGSGKVIYQLGNEPDGHTPANDPSNTHALTQAQWLTAWGNFYAAIHAAYPAARFAGPDIYNPDPNTTGDGWTEAFVAQYGANVVLMTQHLYTNNVANMTLANDLPSAIIKWTLAPLRLALGGGLPARKSENNDAVGGGIDGLSNGGIAIPWVVAEVIQLAQQGWAGINIHTSPYGANYAAFHYNSSETVWTGAASWTAWPKLYGMVLASAANGAGLLPLKMMGGGGLQLGMAFKNAVTGNIQFLVTNTDPANAASIKVAQPGSFTTQSVLIAACSSPTAVPSTTSAPCTLGGQPINADGTWTGAAASQAFGTVVSLPPASAALITIQ